jgi:hypothetical protein
MSPIQRFTRDGASRYVWAALALAAIVGLAFATTAGRRALDDERAIAKERAVRFAEDELGPRLEDLPLSTAITGRQEEELQTFVGRSILSDERVTRVRIWSSPGAALLFSTDHSFPPGSKASLNQAIIRQASAEGPTIREGFSDTGGDEDPERNLFRTYVPVAGAVAEIDQADETTLSPVRSEWFRYQLLAAALVLAFLIMFALSLRDPIARINAGVPFPETSIPVGYSVIDDDRLHAVHEVYRLASERIARLQEKLSESEEDRRRLEGVIQRALSKASSTASGPTSSGVTSSGPGSKPSGAEPTVVEVPDSEVVADTPVDDAWVAAATGALARASREKPLPATSRAQRAAAESLPVPPQRPAAKPKPKSRDARKAAAAARRATTVTPVRTPPSPDQEIADAKAHAAAIERFIRLSENDRQQEDTTSVDQGAVRAALARTAARKKRQGEQLRSNEDPVEVPEGTPNAAR